MSEQPVDREDWRQRRNSQVDRGEFHAEEETGKGKSLQNTRTGSALLFSNLLLCKLSSQSGTEIFP